MTDNQTKTEVYPEYLKEGTPNVTTEGEPEGLGDLLKQVIEKKARTSSGKAEIARIIGFIKRGSMGSELMNKLSEASEKGDQTAIVTILSEFFGKAIAQQQQEKRIIWQQRLNTALQSGDEDQIQGVLNEMETTPIN